METHRTFSPPLNRSDVERTWDWGEADGPERMNSTRAAAEGGRAGGSGSPVAVGRPDVSEPRNLRRVPHGSQREKRCFLVMRGRMTDVSLVGQASPSPRCLPTGSSLT